MTKIRQFFTLFLPRLQPHYWFPFIPRRKKWIYSQNPCHANHPHHRIDMDPEVELPMAVIRSACSESPICCGDYDDDIQLNGISSSGMRKRRQGKEGRVVLPACNKLWIISFLRRPHSHYISQLASFHSRVMSVTRQGGSATKLRSDWGNSWKTRI